MCGILCHVSRKRTIGPNARDTDYLGRRGPDALKTHQVLVTTKHGDWNLSFTSSVLALRGDGISIQPIVDAASGSVLCWNGEAWLFEGEEVTGNDTSLIADRLFEAVSERTDSEATIAKVISKITGPFAFTFWHAPLKKLYFGRDALGRRSLLIHNEIESDGELIISSVATRPLNLKAAEVQTPYAHLMNFNQSFPAVEMLRLDVETSSINRSLPHCDKSTEALPSTKARNDLCQNLRESLQLRVQAVPTYTPVGEDIQHSKVAILFSGGLDCTLIARLVHEILPKEEPIDLLNVAFENPRVANARARENSRENLDPYETCPDRMTGRSSFTELLEVCSSRTWRLVAVNISFEEYIQHRQTIVELMYPHNTEMDLSITSALYFAARGKGMMSNDADLSSARPYTTTARVLLSGLGADELFGGYARHAAAFTRNGYDGLNDELELDFKRIGTRNLGRDDRVIAHWGRETRYPFLDEHFIDFALGLPAWEKCGFRTGHIVPKHFEEASPPEKMEDLHPEKMLLRCTMWELGMRNAAAEKKRAIQFGARTAKMHIGKTKGTDTISLDESVINGP